MGDTSTMAEMRLFGLKEAVICSYFPSIPTITMQENVYFSLASFFGSSYLVRQFEAINLVILSVTKDLVSKDSLVLSQNDKYIGFFQLSYQGGGFTD